MPPNPIRGRTIQNCVPSFMWAAMLLSRLAVTMMCDRSSLKADLVDQADVDVAGT